MNLAKYIFLLSVSICIATSCKKEDDSRHKDIVTATINGKPWKAGCKESPPFGCKVADLQYYTNNGGLEFSAGNLEGNIGIQFRLWEVFQAGSYRIPHNQVCGGIILDNEPCRSWQLFINEDDPQEIKITNIDLEKKIIEGTFHFVGNDSICSNAPTIITDGYFKLKYRP